MSDDWQRPENVEFPQIWRKFESKKLINGVKRQFWIQDIDESLKAQVVDFMCTDLVNSEPLCYYSKMNEDPVSLAEIREIWNDVLKQKLGLVCLTINENGDKEIVGMNVTCRESKIKKDDLELKGRTINAVFGSIGFVSKKRNIFEELGIDAYLTALGLLVLPKFRGEGIGLELLKAREKLCKAVGIKASATSFTSIFSQRLAEKAGFKNLVEISYKDLEKVNPDYSFPGITEHTKTLRHMYIVYN